MSDIQTKKVKIEADTADEATAAAKKKTRDGGGDVRGALMPILLSEGEWEVEVLVAPRAYAEPKREKPPLKKAPAKKAAPKKPTGAKGKADKPKNKKTWLDKLKGD